MNPVTHVVKGLKASLLFYKDGFGIKPPTKVDMSSKKKKKKKKSNFVKGVKYVAGSIVFQIFCVQAFKIVVDSWRFSMLLLYILWDDWLIFMISGLQKQLQ